MSNLDDSMVEISRSDLTDLLLCAKSYDIRLPYGILPTHLLSLLTPTNRELS